MNTWNSFCPLLWAKLGALGIVQQECLASAALSSASSEHSSTSSDVQDRCGFRISCTYCTLQ